MRSEIVNHFRLHVYLQRVAQRFRQKKDSFAIMRPIRAFPESCKLNYMRRQVVGGVVACFWLSPASDPRHDEQAQAVERVLSSLDVSGTPRLLVYNKADRLADGARMLALRDDAVAVSAVRQEGFRDLIARCEEILWKQGRVLAPGAQPEFARPRY